MRFWIVVAALVFSVLYFRVSEKQKYSSAVVSMQAKNRNDSLLGVVEHRCDLIHSMQMKGKNGYIVLEHPTFVSFIVFEEATPYVRVLSVDEFRNGQWVSIFKGEKQHPVQVIELRRVVEGRIRIKVVRAYKIPHIKRVALYAERILEYE